MSLEIAIAFGMLLCNMIMTGLVLLRSCQAVSMIRKAEAMANKKTALEGIHAGEI